MRHHRFRETTATLLATLMLLTSIMVSAEEMTTTYQQAQPEYMVADALLLRPMGLAATAIGTAVFIISLPFGLITGSVDQAADALVVEPARYTFVRPLGQTDSYYSSAAGH